MHNKNKYFRNVRLLIFTVMICFSLIIVSLFEYQQIKLHRQKQTENEYITLNNHANILDQELRSAFEYVDVLPLESSVRKFAGKESVNQYDKIQLYKYISDTMPHKGISGIEVIMYKPEYDCFISESGIEHLDDINDKLGNIPYEHDSLAGFDENTFIRLSDKYTGMDESSYIIFFVKKSVYVENNLCFLVVLNKTVMTENMENESLNGFYINEKESNLFKYDSLSASDKKQAIWKSSIVIPEWKYGIATDEFKVPFYFSVQFAIILLCFFVLTLWLSKYIAIKIYKPFGTFLKKYFEQSDEYDEFGVMESTFESLIEKNNELKKHQEEHEKMLKGNFLKDIFMGKIGKSEIENKKELFSLRITDDFYCAVCGVLMFDSSDIAVINNKPYEDLLEKIADELAAESFELSLGKTVFLYPKSKNNEAETIILKNLTSAEQKLNIRIKAIMLDHRIAELSDMYGLYTEIIEISDIHMASIENTVYHYGGEKKKYDRYYYPIEVEDSLVSFVREGNQEGFYNLLSHVLDVNADKREISSEEIVEFKFALMMTAKRIVETFGLTEAELANGENIREKIAFSRDQEKLKVFLYAFYNNVFNAIVAKNTDNQNVLFNEINDYVMDNFSNTEEMSVVNIAARFNISVGYVSKLYKKMTGQTFIDYVLELRIKKAKSLLKDKSMIKIKEIGESVGYLNTTSFVRVFKKKTGISPNEYRSKCIVDDKKENDKEN